MGNRAGLIVVYVGLFAGLVAIVPLMRIVYFFVMGSDQARLLPLLVFLVLLTLSAVLVLGGFVLRALARHTEAIRELRPPEDR